MKRFMSAACVSAAILAPAARADVACTMQWQQMQKVLGSVEAVVAEEGAFCTARDIHMRSGAHMKIVATELRWRIEGLEQVVQGMPPHLLDVQFAGLRLLPSPADRPLLAYLLAVQNSASEPISGHIVMRSSATNRTWAVEQAVLDLPGDNSVALSYRIEGLDVTDLAAYQASLGSARLHDAKLKVQSHGAFETFLAMPLGNALLRPDRDPAPQVEALKAQAIGLLALLPETVLSEQSASDLVRVIQSLPHPRGTLELSLTSDTGVSAARFAPMALTGIIPVALEAALDGAQIEAHWMSSE